MAEAAASSGASPASRDALEPTSFAALDGWAGDDHDATLAAFRASAERHLDRPFRSRPLSPLDGFERIARVSREASDARDFLESHFNPFILGNGKLTGYYEPIVAASRVRTDDFPVPLHARPPELVDLPDPTMRYGRIVDGVARPYLDRGAIQDGALDGRGLEIAWLRDRVDAFIVHVQGAARLEMSDGTRMRVTYAAKSGHDYTSLGARLLARLREARPDLPAAAVTADVLTGWMRDNPVELGDFLAQNRSYIFFRRAEDAGAGPVAAAKVALAAGRSLAVDRALHSFGLPFWIETRSALPGSTAPLRRLVVAQDTGSAIVGPARGDLFVGSGDEAGRIAGAINHEARFVVLLPREAA